MTFKALDFFGRREIQIITIENPYDLFEYSEEVRQLLCEGWVMKLNGYKDHYPYGILPVGEADWFSNQTMICEVIDGKLKPFVGYKQVTSDHCKSMNKEFPIIPHLFAGQERESESYIEAIHSFVREKEKKDQLVGYNSGWTMARHAKEDKQLQEIARNLSMTMYYHYYTSYGIENVITAASAKFKVWRIQETMGFDYLKVNGEKLPPHPSKEFFGEEFYIMHLQDNGFPLDFIVECEKHRELWENRRVINAESLGVDVKKAA